MSDIHAKICALTDKEKQQLELLKQFWYRDTKIPQLQKTREIQQQKLL